LSKSAELTLPDQKPGAYDSLGLLFERYLRVISVALVISGEPGGDGVTSLVFVPPPSKGSGAGGESEGLKSLCSITLLFELYLRVNAVTLVPPEGGEGREHSDAAGCRAGKGWAGERRVAVGKRSVAVNLFGIRFIVYLSHRIRRSTALTLKGGGLGGRAHLKEWPILEWVETYPGKGSC
jgi:hypothetical protein